MLRGFGGNFQHYPPDPDPAAEGWISTMVGAWACFVVGVVLWIVAAILVGP